ncbi:MAG: response regulator [Geobacter sp.]|nr:response regulator [Geobacter sp.]
MKPTTVPQTILIVDDEPVSVEMLSNLLEGEYKVIMAHSGQETLEIVSRIIPDLILLDILMPVMDGYEVFRIIKRKPELKDVPVLFITALGEAECESEGLELGAADYIIKPFNSALVRLRVKNHLELKRQRDLLTSRAEELQRLNTELAHEVTERRYVQQANEELIKELRNAMAEVRTLSGLLPICSSCKQVRDDQGYWSRLETYLSKHTDISFSHGLCKECAQKIYPDYCDRQPARE